MKKENQALKRGSSLHFYWWNYSKWYWNYEAFYIFIGEIIPNNTEIMSSIYEKYKNEDVN